MFFPEELDNRSFRLFVFRTWHLMNSKMALSPTEKELASLIEEHPEIGIFIPGMNIQINRHFDEDEYNPFLYLAALWEVAKQLRDDRPQGIKTLVRNSSLQNFSESQVRSHLAQAYIDLYLQEKNGEREFDKDSYLKEIDEILNKPLYFELANEKRYKGAPVAENNVKTDYYFKNLFNQIFNSVQHSFHEEASTKPIQVKTRLQAAMNKLPAEWIDAIALYWKRPAVRLKRDRIQDLIAFLTSVSAPDAIDNAISDEERAILKILIEHDGYIQYGQIRRKFGGEEEDDYWWTNKPPQSAIGRLRHKGLVYVGKAPINSRNYKVIVIPQELIPVIQYVLNR